MNRTFVFAVALILGASPALAQSGGGGAGGGASSGSGGASSGAAGTPSAGTAASTAGGNVAKSANPSSAPFSNPIRQGTGPAASNGDQHTGQNSSLPQSAQSPTPTAKQASPGDTVAAEQKAATQGTNTAAPDSAAGAGAVGAPGVGVGHTANGKPIGTTGSGPGSPEQPIGSGNR